MGGANRPAPRLRGNLRTDVCVVGAGMAGLSTAWRLTAAGYSVVVLEAREPGMGETSRTTAHLVTALDRGWNALVGIHGDELARLAADSHRAAIDEIEAVCSAEGIDCQFERVDGFLFAGPGTPHTALEAELDAARRAGVEGVEMASRAPLRFDTGPCLRFPRQGVCHPLRLLAGLGSAIVRREGRIFARARVEAIDVGRPIVVRVAGGASVTADAVVIATNSPIAGAPTLHAMQAPYRTYAIAATVPRGSITNALYWDTEEPFHYARLERSNDQHDILIVGGEDHKTGQGGGTANERYRRLVRWSRLRFPTMGAVASHWSGQVMESGDGLAFIGRAHANADVFVVTGDSGNGMTHGMVAALLLGELIARRSSPWQAVYDPHRFRVGAVGRIARENVNVARQLADWVRPGDLGDAATIAASSGAVLRRGLRRVAAYRRPSGQLCELSAICPHLGCIVRWNAAERTWDCPCHGSRFHPEGHVISGPATRGLAPLESETESAPARRREQS